MQEPTKQQPLYSRHVLFFCFQWRVPNHPNGSSRQQLRALSQRLTTGDSHWHHKPITRTTDPSAYSGHNYLHDFAQGVVFDTGHEDAPMRHFFAGAAKTITLGVRAAALPDELKEKLAEGTTSQEFALKLFMAHLNLYETGVGVLILFVDNFKHPTAAEVLVINDVIRRLYPPHLHYKMGVESAKNSGLLADRIAIGDWVEDFTDFAPSDGRLNIPPHFLPKHLMGLLGPRFYANASTHMGDALVQHVLDDRMYLACFVDDAALANRLKGVQQGDQLYLDDPFWYAYVFVDKGEPQIRNQSMMRQLLSAATYPRWTEDGTFFGISRYSFVMLTYTTSQRSLKTPFTENYTRLVTLCLVQRASVLRFREEAARIAADIADATRLEAVAERIRVLYGEYIRFVNQFYFLEATPVEQGTELYDLLRSQMRVQEQVAALKDELADMNAYAGLLQEEAQKIRAEEQKALEETRNKALNALTVLGAAFLIPSLALSYFGLSDDWNSPLKHYPLRALGIIMIGGVFGPLVFYYRAQILRQTTRMVLVALAFLVYLWILWTLPHWIEWGWLPERVFPK